MEMIKVQTRSCIVCHRTAELSVPAEGFAAWRVGAFIQDALPGLTDDERELLQSGLHPDCFDEVVPDDEED